MHSIATCYQVCVVQRYRAGVIHKISINAATGLLPVANNLIKLARGGTIIFATWQKA